MVDHLRRLGLSPACPRVVVHGRLISFGRIIGGVETVHRAIQKVLGADATIAVPTYTFHLGENDVYDPEATKARGMGAYSDFILAQPGCARSLCPIHNHALLGNIHEDWNAVDGSVSIGRGSDFEFFHTHDYDLVLLGCGLQEGGTYLHHLEAIAEVPYRDWITLKRKVRGRDGTVHDKQVRYFARRSCDVKENFRAIEDALVSSGIANKVDAPYGYSLRVPLKKLHNFVMDMLAKDPYSLVVVE